ncbi:MAG: hypothetical protein RJA22_1634 [Verrucomicrobiota bacterium]|jgi:RND family efflux transporter MFP subunit
MNPDKTALEALRIDRRPPPRPSRAPWVLVGVLLLAGLGGAFFWWQGRVKAAVVQTVAVREMAGAAVGGQTLLNASGYVTARRVATVSSKVSGKVVEVLVEEGMRVEAGQVLARLDASNVERSLRLAEAQLESARKALDETRANLDKAEREYRRVMQLATNQIASPSDLDRAEAEAKSLLARLAKQAADVGVAEGEVAVWKQQLDDTIIRAPFTGIVTSKNAQPGEMISPLSAGGGFTRTGICTIVDMTSLEVEVDVNESYINRVTAGQPVEATLDAYADWRIPSRVIAIIPTADRQKATVKVRVGFERLDARMLPEMGVKVAFQGGAGTNGVAGAGSAGVGGGLVLPRSALRPEAGRDYVWVVRSGRVERRAVTVGEARGAEVVLAAGVRGGERVVVEGPARLEDGQAVAEGRP